MASPESDEEYLDDPIRLIDLRQKRITAAGRNYNAAVDTTYPTIDLTGSNGDLCIEKNNNLSKKSLPRFKEVSITLPVTFFEISRNVEQLNKCKPLSIEVVNCEKFPWYHKKYLNKQIGKGEDAMTVKIRPVSSPYRNLKTSESKLLQCQVSKQKTISGIKYTEDSHVNFKKNLGLIGMKITQTHDLDSKFVHNKTNAKIERDKNNTAPKVSSSSAKVTNNKCGKKKENNKNTLVNIGLNEIKNKTNDHGNRIKNTLPKDSTTSNESNEQKIENNRISTTNPTILTNDKIIVKCAEKKNINKTKQRNKTEIQDVLMNDKVADKWKVNTSKVEYNIAQKTDLESQEVIYNKHGDSKQVPLTNEQGNLKLLISRDSRNDTFQSAFVNDNNVQKSNLAGNKTKHDPKHNSVNLVGCKVKKSSEKPSVKKPEDMEMDKSFCKGTLEAENKIVNNNEAKNDQVKGTCKEIGNNCAKLAGNKELDSKLNCTPTNKSILNVKLVKPKENIQKPRELSNIPSSGNQKGNYLNCNAAIASLIKGQSKVMKQMLPKNTNCNVDQRESTPTHNKVAKIPYQALQTLVKKGGIKTNNHSQKNHCDMKEAKNITELRNTNGNTTSTTPCTYVSNKTQSEAELMNFEETPKITVPPSQQISCVVSNSKHLSQKPHIPVKDPRHKNNIVFVPVTNTIPVSNHPSITDSILKNLVQNKPKSRDMIDLTINNSPKQHRLRNSINLNSRLLRPCTTNIDGASNESWITNDSRASMETQQVFTDNNTMKQLYDPQIPLDIPPNAKRYPRLIKISKRYPGATESIINNCNYFNSTPSPHHASNSNEVLCNQTYNIANINQIQSQPYPSNYENSGQNVQNQQFSSLHQNQEATNPQMLAFYHAAAQQLSRQPLPNESLLNMENIAKQGEPVSRQLLSANVQHNAPQITPKNMRNQAAPLLQTTNQKNAPEILPPTCDVAVIPPRHDFNTRYVEIQHQQRPNLPRIILRKPLSKQQIPNTSDHSIIPRHEVPQPSYSNFGYNAPKNIQPNIHFAQGFQKAHSDISKIPPQNYVHCAPIYSGLPRNIGSVDLAPYNNCWNNYYPMTLSAVPQPLPPTYPDFIQTQKQLASSTSIQTCGLNNQSNVIISTANSVSGTTIIGCNNSGPVRKINILSEPVEVSSVNTQPPFVTVQPGKDNNETAKYNTNISNLSRDTINDTEKKTITNEQKAEQIQGILKEVDILNSKREMLEELSKLTTIESSCRSPVNDLKRPLPTGLVDQEAIVHKRPSTEPEKVLIEKPNVSQRSKTVSATKQAEGNMIKSPLPKNDLQQQDYKFFKIPLPKSGTKQDEGKIINGARSKPVVKQQKTKTPKISLPGSELNQDESNSTNKTIPKSVANQEKSNSQKRVLPAQNEPNLMRKLKPGPLSKKQKLNPTSPALTRPVHKGYSPPILPIPTYEKSLEILARCNISDSSVSLPTINETEYESAEIREDNRYMSNKQEKSAKKISLDEYKKRYQGDFKADELEVNEIFLEIESETAEQDLGYVSDGPTKL